MKNLNDHIELLISLQITGEINADQQAELTAWLNESEENRAYLEQARNIFEEATRQEMPKVDVNREWALFEAKYVSVGSKRPAYQWLRMAASMALIAVLGYFIWNVLPNTKNITVVADTEIKEVILPDSSVVTLNKNARITYSRNFAGDIRKVTMTGEAFFEVTRNATKPFIVQMENSTVEVLGTTFNIDASSEDTVEVVVNSGLVKFSNITTLASVNLSIGEKGILMNSTQQLTKSVNRDVNFNAWKTRRIVFSDMELDEVIKSLNHLYEAHITFSTDVQQNCSVTVSFDNQSLDAVLRVLEATLELEYTKSGDDIIITKTGC